MARISDRYVKAVLTVIAFALVMLAVNPWVTFAGRISNPGAPDSPQAAQTPQPQAMPRAWGRVAGMTVDKWIVFEATDGTIRMVALGGGVMREFKRN